MADQNRTTLTFEEKIIVAWSYHVRGISQQDLAGIFNINSGRISEACKAVEKALKDDHIFRITTDFDPREKAK